MVAWRGKETVQALFASALLLCAIQLRFFFGTLRSAHGSENDLTMLVTAFQNASVDVKESLFHTSIQSDIVELDHCSLIDLNDTHFWYAPFTCPTI
jgi:hypothetical protein